MGRDANGFKTGLARGDAANGVEHTEDRMGAPGVGIGAGVVRGFFGDGGESILQHAAPWIQPLRVVVAEAGIDQRLVGVESEIEGRGGEIRLIAHATGEGGELWFLVAGGQNE